jgi:tRNA threonylcarbamoyladenosine biosynthesis protein TsaB
VYLLSFDTSSSWLCVALSEGETLRGSYCRRHERGHATYLVPVIAALLKRCGIVPRQLNGLAVVNGPGSFTGLRVGLATAKGLAMACALPVAQLASLDVLATPAASRGRVVVPVIDARRQQVYAAVYGVSAGRKLVRRSPLLLAEPAAIMKRVAGDAVFLGDGIRVIGEALRRQYPQAVYLPDSFNRPRPAVLATLAFAAHSAGDTVSGAALSARYLYKDNCAVRLCPQKKSGRKHAHR